jgi:hypothetical protein
LEEGAGHDLVVSEDSWIPEKKISESIGEL